ncbi:hypothetical protein MRX96_001070 [Rhipicephalus microplus]
MSVVPPKKCLLETYPGAHPHHHATKLQHRNPLSPPSSHRQVVPDDRWSPDDASTVVVLIGRRDSRH